MPVLSLVQEIEDFLHRSPTELTDRFRTVVEETAKTASIASWPALKLLVVFQLQKVVAKYSESSSAPPASDEAFMQKFEEIKQKLQSYEEPPFTIQRICELVLNPSTYGNVHGFLSAFGKNVSGISMGLHSAGGESLLRVDFSAAPMEITHPALLAAQAHRVSGVLQDQTPRANGISGPDRSPSPPMKSSEPSEIIGRATEAVHEDIPAGASRNNDDDVEMSDVSLENSNDTRLSATPQTTAQEGEPATMQDVVSPKEGDKKNSDDGTN
eukprot:40741_1